MPTRTAAQTKRAPAKRPAAKAKPAAHPADLPQLLYTKAEAAVILRIGVRTVEKLIARGTLASMKAGRWRCVPLWAIEQYITDVCGAS